MKSIKYLLLVLIGCLLLQCKKSNTDVPPPKVITGVYFPDISIVKGGIVDHSDNMTIYGHVWDTIPAPEINGSSPKSQYSYQGFNGDTLEVISQVDFTEGTTYYIRGYARDKFGDVFYGQYEIIYDPTNPANNPTACFETNMTECQVSCTINFDADCSTPEIFISSYKWDFDGDGIFDVAGSNRQAVSYTYTSAGTYSAKLEVLTITGVASDTTINIQVNQTGSNLVACFAMSKDECDIDDCAVNFDASCSSVNANSYKWDFDGNGVFDDTGQLSEHSYIEAGTYNVKLEIEDAYGNINNTTQTVNVYNINVSFTFPDDVYENCEITFVNNSQGAASYLWNFGDGNTSTETNPTHIYDNPGNYTVTLTVINGEIEEINTQDINVAPDIRFEKIRDIGSDNDIYESVITLINGGYVIAGHTESQGAGQSDVYVVKVDANGNMQWEKTFGGSDYDSAHSIISTPDDGHVIAGRTSSQGAGGSDVYLIKIDANGNMQWEKTFGGSGNDSAYSIISAPDGSYVIAGNTWSQGAGFSDVYLIKTDANGNMQWEKTFGGSDSDEANSVISVPDGGYIIVGYTQSQGAGGADIYLIKIDANGNTQWEKTFGGSGYDTAYSIVSAPDGGYAIAGCLSQETGDHAYLIKTDVNGNMQWEKTFDGGGIDDGVYSMVSSSEGGYVLAGKTHTHSQGAGWYDAYLIKIDANGNMLWEKTFGGTSADFAYSIQVTNDCGFIIAGEYRGLDPDFYLIKTDSEGNAQ